MLYPLGKLLTYWFVHIMYRMRYEGLENIPPETGFILACNHRSFIDPLAIAHKVPKPVRYMAKAELFRIPVLGFLIRHLYAFPVARGTGDTSAIDTATRIIREGGVLGVFPEGTRSKDGKALRARSGVALIAAQTGADVLPCAVCFGERLGFRTPVTVRYGQLISSEELGVNAESRSTIKAASKLIMNRILALLDEEGDGCR